jgi:hypothetical protein
MASSGFIDWALRSRTTGKITINQAPNRSQKLFQLLTLTGVLLPKSKLRANIGVLAVTALGWWATDEIVRGVNPVRRATGVTALLVILWLARRTQRRPARSRAL